MNMYQRIRELILIASFNFFILKYAYSQQCSQHMTFLDNHIYRRLFGFILETWSDVKLHDCARWCLSDRRCKSFNHREDLNMCDLNSEWADIAGEPYMIQYENNVWQHFDIRTWKEVWNPGCDGSLCPMSNRCLKSKGRPICYENPRRCPDGFFQFEEKCYVFKASIVPWNQAMAKCNEINTTLGTVRTWNENTYVIEVMKGLIGIGELSAGIWSGIQYNDSNGGWVFQPDMTLVNMSYATWPTGFNVDGNCCWIKYEPAIIGAWQVIHCTATTSYFCETTV